MIRERQVFTFKVVKRRLAAVLVIPFSALCFSGAKAEEASRSLPAAVPPGKSSAATPWHRNIVTTYFYIGKDANSLTPTTNFSSAWDAKWMKNYGGSDANHAGLLPAKFAPTQNPFYVALPFNDVAYPDLARKYVPWYSPDFARAHPYISQCKGHWIEIRCRDTGKVAYAQWQDVGPLRTDHAAYVFGSDTPHDFNHAGLDVSPAVRDCLGLSGLDATDWRFVDEDDVPAGPWRTYGEQAVIYAALKAKEQQIAEDWRPASRRSVASATVTQ